MTTVLRRSAGAMFAALLVGGLTACTSHDDTSSGGGDSSSGESKASEYELTDAAGRTVAVPPAGEIDTVFPTAPTAQAFIYTFDPDKLAGWNYELVEQEKKYIDEKYQKLPVVGGAYGKSNKINTEELLKQDPSIILDVGAISDASKASADELQQATGIPVVMLSSDFADMAETYETMGQILGDEDRGSELSEKTSAIVDGVSETAATIEDSEKVTVYYAEGPTGLQTDPSGSEHSRIIDTVGAVNVADIESASGYGRVDVNAEQVLTWNPDWVIVCPEVDGENALWNDPMSDGTFGQLEAVQAGKVLSAPYGPFNWFDRPPSVNQLTGLLLTAESLYPDVYDIDLVDETANFYKSFYDYDLSDTDAETLLKEAGAQI